MQTYFKHGMGDTITLYFEIFRSNVGQTGESPVVAVQKRSTSEWLDDTKTVWASDYNDISMTETSSGSLPGVYSLDVTHIDGTAETYSCYFTNSGANTISDFESHMFTGAVYVPSSSAYSSGTVLGNLDIIKNKDGARTFDQATDSLEAISDTGLDATNLVDIADAVWTQPSSGYYADDTTMGYMLITGGGGPGANVANILVNDIDTGLPIPDTFVKVTDATNILTIAKGYTNSSGIFPAGLDDGDYNVILRKAFTDFTVPETLTVAGSGTHTYEGSGFSAANPSASGTCVVYGWVTDIGGSPVKNAKIKATETIDSRFNDSNKIVKVTKTASSDSGGYFELELLRSSNLTHEGVKYRINITYTGFSYEAHILVPDASMADFSTLV
ncbi:hypothetical protein KAR91_33445 [Candidatus Pacearchaeota archaeon]|nr:hypothetical protein [Candidatus Pacearchaeota archaeon]